MAIVVQDQKLLTTMVGHYRENLPFPPGESSLSYAKEKQPAAYQDLLKQFGSDEAILEALDEDFEMNSLDWMQAGFIKGR